MWVERLEIGGFGRLTGTFDFAKGLNVVSGPNEAGKSTLKEALLRAMFGFPRTETHRSRIKRHWEPWVHPTYGLVALVRDVSSRSMRIEWDFDAHHIELFDAATGDDLSNKVRGARTDVELGPYLLSLPYEDFCQVCCLGQATLNAVQRTDSLVNAIQEAVDSSSSDVRVADAEGRLGDAVNLIGFNRGSYNVLAGRPYRGATSRLATAEDELAACLATRAEIEEHTRELFRLDDRISELDPRSLSLRQHVLRVQVGDLRGTLERAGVLQRAATQRPDEKSSLPQAQRDRVRRAQEALAAAERSVAEAAELATGMRGRLADLRAEERELTARVDALASYSDVDPSAEGDVTKLMGRLEDLRTDVAPEDPEVPEPDPVLEKFRERKAELLTNVRKPRAGYRTPVLAAALAVATVSIALAVMVSPVALVGALIAAAIVVVAGREPVAEGLTSDFMGEPIVRLDARLTEHDAAVRSAQARAEQNAEDRARRATRVADSQRLLGETLADAGAAGGASLEERASAYLTACRKFSELSQVKADLANVQAAIATGSQTERDLRTRETDHADALAELENAYRALAIDPSDLDVAAEGFDARVVASAAADEQRQSAAQAEAELFGLLEGRSIEIVAGELENLEIALREHAANHGELPPEPGDLKWAESELEAVRSDLADSREARKGLEVTIDSLSKDLPEPADLIVEIDQLKEQISRIEFQRDALQLARETLEEAAHEVHREFAPKLNDALERNLPRITGGRYQQVLTADDLSLKLIAPETNTQVSASQLSRGTQDQIFLVQRLELARLLDPTVGAAPLLLDDPFARSDPKRTRLGLELLAEMAEDRQIVVFSEDPSVATLADEICDSCHVVELPEPVELAVPATQAV